MLGADVAMIQTLRLGNDLFDGLFPRSGEARPACSGLAFVAVTLQSLDGVTHVMQIHTLILQRLCSHALALAHEAKPEMFNANDIALESLRLLLGKVQHPSGT